MAEIDGLDLDLGEIGCSAAPLREAQTQRGVRIDQDDRGVAWIGQFGTTSAPRWPHLAHTKPSLSDLTGVSSGRWPTFMIVLWLQRPELQ